MSHVLAQVLVRRGIERPGRRPRVPRSAGGARPGAFNGIDRAVGLIERHIAAGSRIVVHGDYDVDGVCATAIMVRALRARGAERRVVSAGPAGGRLRVVARDGPPAGRPRHRSAGHRRLRDHRGRRGRCGRAGRARRVGLRPSRPARGRRASRLRDRPPGRLRLPVRRAVRDRASRTSSRRRSARRPVEEDLELVALATVADLMPLVGENRRLVREGLLALARTARPGLRALMSAAGVDPSALDTHALGFRLAPRINAAGRLRRADAGLELLLTDDEARAAQIASELDRVNAERRAVEQRIVWEAEAQVAELGERRAYVLAGEGWHPGVVGIVASRVVERHHRPAVVVGTRRRAGLGVGPQHPGLRPAVGAARGRRAPRTLRRPSGRGRHDHPARADRGVPGGVRAPRRRGSDARAAGAGGARRRDRLRLRARPRAGRGARALEPCGIGNPGRRLLVPGARLRDLRPMGEGRHLRFSVRSGGGQGPRGRVRLRRPAAGSSRRNRPMPRSGSSATSGTGPSSRGWCCATPAVQPGADRGARRAGGLPGGRCSRSCGATPRRRAVPVVARTRGPCWTVAATARSPCCVTRGPPAARCWRCAPTSRAGCGARRAHGRLRADRLPCARARAVGG